MLRDQTLVPLKPIGFPAIPGVSDPRTIEGPGTRWTRPLHGAALPRAARRRGRQRGRRHSRARTRRAAGDDDRLELPSRAHRQPVDDLRAARLVRSVRANEGGARRATRSAPVSRRTLSRSRRLPAEDSASRPRRSSKIACCCRRMSTTSSNARRGMGARDRNDCRRTGIRLAVPGARIAATVPVPSFRYPATSGCSWPALEPEYAIACRREPRVVRRDDRRQPVLRVHVLQQLVKRVGGASRRDRRSARRRAATPASSTSARATATRCCSPPDISLGRCFSRSPSPTRDSRSTARRRAALPDSRATRIGISTFSVASNSGIR